MQGQVALEPNIWNDAAAIEAIVVPGGQELVVRTEFTDPDADAIVALHDRVYCTEFGFDARFAASVAWSIETARADVFTAHAERENVDIPGNLRVGNTDESEGGLRLQQDLLVDV